MSNRPHGREDPRGYGARREDDRDRDEGRPRGPDSLQSRFGGRGGRPLARTYRPGPGPNGPRSRTPSPRRFERDPRDARDFSQSDTRRGYPGPGPGRDNRRWDRRDEHPRDYSPPWDGPLRRPSPPPHARTHSPPRGPRLQPTSYTPTPRLPSGPRPGYPGTRPFDQDRMGGPGPSTIANQSAPPRAPRSMRGSSSPVETRNGTWPNHGSSSVPVRNIDLPTDIAPDVEPDQDLEEGEVVSPPRKPIEPPTTMPRQGDRWAPPPRRSPSPRKPPFRSRPVSPIFHDRERDRGWGSSRRTLSPAMSRPGSRAGDSRNRGSSRDRISNGIQRSASGRTTSPPKVSVDPRRPSTPSAAGLPYTASVPSPPVRPNTPLLPEPKPPSNKKSPLSQTINLPPDRPRTPELPPPLDSVLGDVPEETMQNGLDLELVPVDGMAVLPETLPIDSPTRPATPSKTPPILDDHPSPVRAGSSPPEAVATTPPLRDRERNTRMTFAVTPPRTIQAEEPEEEDILEEVADQVSETVTRVVTIAERRAVELPANVVPHFSARLRRSFPRADSVPSTRTGATSPDPFELTEEERELKLAAAVKAAQQEDADHGPTVDDQVRSIYAANLNTASRRPPARRNDNALIRQVSASMESANEPAVLVQDSLLRAIEERRRRDVRLRSQYTILKTRWETHHEELDEQMAKRAPRPRAGTFYEVSLSVKDPEAEDKPEAMEEVSTNRNRNSSQAQFESVLARSALEIAHNPVELTKINGIEVPGMLDIEDRRLAIDDDNDLVDDPEEFYDFAGVQEPVWTDEERAIFAKIFPNCHKEFGKIASKLPNKSIRDCVLYYYRTKKDIEWKREVKQTGGNAQKAAKTVVKKPAKNAFNDDLPSPPIQANTPGPSRGGGRGRGRGGRGRGGGTHIPADSIGKGRPKSSLLNARKLDAQSSEATSRAVSEAPGAAKPKARAPPKAKRPRESSVLEPVAGPSNLANEIIEPPIAEDQDTEMLPAAKRGGKRRKVVGPDGVEIATEKGEKRKRTSANSYWNKDENAALERLARQYPNDPERIAQELTSKTPKQVANRLAHAGDEFRHVGPTRLAPGSLDYYSSHEHESKPRLGEFPDGPSSSAPPRTGGLSVNALLNADSSDVRVGTVDHTDAASDGTVDDEGLARPPSRNVPPRPLPPTATYDRQGYMSRPYDSYPQRIHPNAPTQGAYYPHPSSSTPAPRSYPPQGWGAPPHQQHPHQAHQHHPHPQQPPHHPYMHAPPRPPPQLGSFGRPPPDFGGRTVYNVLQRERPTPPQKDKNRSEGPAFTGFKDDKQGKPDPPPP